MLRAAKRFDVSELPIKPFTESTIFRTPEQKNRVLLCAYGATFVLLAIFVYGFTTKTEMVSEWVCMVWTLLLSCVALITVRISMAASQLSKHQTLALINEWILLLVYRWSIMH